LTFPAKLFLWREHEHLGLKDIALPPSG